MDALRDSLVVVVVVVAMMDGGRDVLLVLAAVVLSVVLLDRRRLKGFSWWKEAMELRRCIELRREADDGAASLECDLCEGMMMD